VVVIEVQLLTGRYVAIADNQKATPDARAEWPPHPARLYSALVAALHDRAPPDPLEREVLDKLAAHAPQIEASNVADEAPVPRRSVAKVYVPANDMNALKPLGKLGMSLQRTAPSLKEHLVRVARAEPQHAQRCSRPCFRMKNGSPRISCDSSTTASHGLASGEVR
jgi:CRISPR-associated protein Csb2